MDMKPLFRISLILLLISIVTGCATTTPTATQIQESTATLTTTQGTEEFPWWNDTVFYEIFVRSFRDSDGDGIGDFNGITEKLDYLHDLGIRGIWLMPITHPPSYHGYDVTDCAVTLITG
jgi:pullulanase/glycogen debranching enzyme